MIVFKKDSSFVLIFDFILENMKTVRKFFLILSLFVSQLENILFAAQEVDFHLIESIEQEKPYEEKEKNDWFEKYLYDFFVTESKIHTAFRCALPFLFGYFNFLLINPLLREVNVITNEQNQDSLNADDFIILAQHFCNLLFVNAIFADLYFSVIKSKQEKTAEKEA